MISRLTLWWVWISSLIKLAPISSLGFCALELCWPPLSLWPSSPWHYSNPVALCILTGNSYLNYTLYTRHLIITHERQQTLVHFAGVKCYPPYATWGIGFLTIPEKNAPWQQSPAMPVLEKTRPSEAGIRDYPGQKEDEPSCCCPSPCPWYSQELGISTNKGVSSLC